jgi:predicted nucleic acid-binding protein
VIILDTNIISELMQAEPNPKVFEWLDGVPSESAWITAISVFELRYGIEQLATGRRRQRLQDAFSRVVDIDFHDRILPLDYDSAMATALIAAERKRFGRPAELRDTLIAGIVVSRRAELFATRNIRHFQDLDVRVINPWMA